MFQWTKENIISTASGTFFFKAGSLTTKNRRPRSHCKHDSKKRVRKKNLRMNDRMNSSSLHEELWYRHNYIAQSHINTHKHACQHTHRRADSGVSNSEVKEHNDERSPGSNGAFCVWK